MTSTEFINHIRTALNDHWGYIWGTMGEVWTAEKQAAATREMTIRYGKRWVGHRVTDCSGLLAWAARQGGEYLPHGSNSIWRQSLSAHGEIAPGQALAPGTAVFKRSASGGYDHVGVWDGQQVIEARGTRSGVVASSLAGWTHWGTLAFLDPAAAAPLTGEHRVRSNGLNLRAAPSIQSDRLTILPQGARVTVKAQPNDEWCEVECTLTGYVMRKFLE